MTTRKVSARFVEIAQDLARDHWADLTDPTSNRYHEFTCGGELTVAEGIEYIRSWDDREGLTREILLDLLPGGHHVTLSSRLARTMAAAYFATLWTLCQSRFEETGDAL